jgi:hypothetical protein
LAREHRQAVADLKHAAAKADAITS